MRHEDAKSAKTDAKKKLIQLMPDGFFFVSSFALFAPSCLFSDFQLAHTLPLNATPRSHRR